MREGSLSENNWHFLHGRATTVPGSWIGDTCTCGNASCIGLVGDAKLLTQECSVCKADRQSRHRVMNATDDKQFMETLHTEFVNAPAICLNNDIKYEVNKLRARLSAQLQIKDLLGVLPKVSPMLGL